MDYELLIKLISIPDHLDRKKKKEFVAKLVREEIYKRDYMICQLCGRDESGNLQVHHIIPNGTATPDNLITLCKHCHDAVHMLLYTSKKWKYCNYF